MDLATFVITTALLMGIIINEIVSKTKLYRLYRETAFVLGCYVILHGEMSEKQIKDISKTDIGLIEEAIRKDLVK